MKFTVLLFSSILMVKTASAGCPLEGVWEVDVIRSSVNYLENKDEIGPFDEVHISALDSIQWELTCDMFIIRHRESEAEYFEFVREYPYTWKDLGDSKFLISELTDSEVGIAFEIQLLGNGCFEYFDTRHLYSQIWCKSK